jgi:uncharacterized protein GlcG (DUF336 family)
MLRLLKCVPAEANQYKGATLYLQRSHDTQFGSVETAIMKANASVAFKRPRLTRQGAAQPERRRNCGHDGNTAHYVENLKHYLSELKPLR